VIAALFVLLVLDKVQCASDDADDEHGDNAAVDGIKMSAKITSINQPRHISH
jgi:hypothetical protein